MLNVVDKIIGKPTAFFVGKDRAAQFIEYFSSIGISNPLIANSILIVFAVAEVVAAFYLLKALVKYLKGKTHGAHHAFFRGTIVGLAIFGMFSIGDQIFGDRAELLEHTLYWVSIIISWAAYSYFPRREAK